MQVQVNFVFDNALEYSNFRWQMVAHESVAQSKLKAKVAEEKPKDIMQEDHHEEDRSLTYESVKSAVLKVAKEKGKAAALKALGVIGTDKVGPHIKESDYSKLMAACEKELG